MAAKSFDSTPQFWGPYCQCGHDFEGSAPLLLKMLKVAFLALSYRLPSVVGCIVMAEEYVRPTRFQYKFKYDGVSGTVSSQHSTSMLT